MKAIVFFTFALLLTACKPQSAPENFLQPKTTNQQTTKHTESTAKPSPTPETFDISLLNSEPSISDFTERLKISEQLSMLQDNETVTILAPNNNALADNEDPNLVARHIFVGKQLNLSRLSRETELTNLLGESIPVEVDGEYVTVGGAKFVQSDLGSGPVTLHIIDQSL